MTTISRATYARPNCLRAPARTQRDGVQSRAKDDTGDFCGGAAWSNLLRRGASAAGQQLWQRPCPCRARPAPGPQIGPRSRLRGETRTKRPRSMPGIVPRLRGQGRQEPRRALSATTCRCRSSRKTSRNAQRRSPCTWSESRMAARARERPYKMIAACSSSNGLEVPRYGCGMPDNLRLRRVHQAAPRFYSGSANEGAFSKLPPRIRRGPQRR